MTPLLGWLNPNRTGRTSAPDTIAPGGLLHGWTDWPHDQFYRPVIGIVVDGTVRAVTPTWRRATGTDAQSKAGGNCWFAVTVPATMLAGAASIMAVRMEDCAPATLLDMPARSGPPQPWHGAPMQDRSDQFGGFEHFLALGSDDQLELVCRSLLGQPNPPADVPTAAMIGAQQLTILDFRDALLRCAAYRDAALDQPWQQSGRWLVWSGLDAIVPDLIVREAPLGLTGADDIGGALAAVRAALPQQAYVARLALAPDSPSTEAALWVAMLGRLPEAVVTSTSPTHHAASHPLVLPGLLGAIRPGPAGLRDGRGFASRPGIAGFMVAGPYVRLGPGTWRLVVTLARGADTRPPCGFLEVVHQNIVVALTALGPNNEVELGFCLTEAWAARLSAPLFEIRIWTDGGTRLAICDVALERIGPAGKIPLAGVASWRPLLSIGEAGLDGGTAINAPTGRPGSVFFGPYRALPPGAYRLMVELDQVVNADRGSCTLEILTETGEAIAVTMPNLASGAGEFGVDFVISPALADQRLEFRLRKSVEAGFRVLAVRVTAQADDAF